ncbi:FAD-dependent monooxygenase [Amycolatopsis pithecellobii]|uniref:Monooxygenase n=1 Tax=Amycolatopsis pithecellobii TaxID=664692 RepID=A0A6N7Z4W7_9PSEU|nr:FAD-dependent monooxygenase [Amycolatopsis pithecellobii]MTD55440.1 monooxygenase [Amycolatopsis pithecellobii]
MSETSDNNSHFPVGIIGAGPVGMMLALKLQQLGVDSVVIERSGSARMHPKGNTHNARTMEHYRSLGLAGRVRATGLPLDHPTDVAYFTSLAGREIQRLEMHSCREVLAKVARKQRGDPTPEPVHRSNQMYVEAILLSEVLQAPRITCLMSTECIDFAERDEHVELKLERPTGHETVTVDYLIGCDGPRSMVRRRLGAKYVGEDGREQGFMNGLQHSTYIRVRGLSRLLKDRRCWQYWVIRPEGIFDFVSLDGEDEFIFHAVQEDDLDEEAIRKRVAKGAGADLETEVLGTEDWVAGRALVADSYGAGRVFLCGDSAHLFTPTGGFGMNTGVDDAVNLAWKLAGAVQGWGGSTLMASYELERRPIAIRNTNAALALSKSLRDIPLGAVTDDADTEDPTAVAELAELLKGFKDEFASLGIQLGASYAGSPIVVDDGTPAPPDRPDVYVPTARPGARAPHWWLSTGAALFDEFGPGFTLLCLEGGETAAQLEREAIERSIPLTVLGLVEPGLDELYRATTVLVRPDGHVAWRGSGTADVTGVWDCVTGHEAAR